MKRLIALILSFLIVFPACAEEVWVMCQPNSEVMVRLSPNKHSEQTGRVFAGDRLELTGRKSGRWYEAYVSNEYGRGWIRGDYLSFSEPEVFKDGKQFRTTVGKLVARFSIRGNIRRKFKSAGAIVTVYLMADEWSVTSEGFIMTEFLEEVE